MAYATLANKIEAVADLIRLRKQYGTLLVLWPTLWSLFIAASGTPSVKHVVIFIAGSFLMRSAGCAINDVADRKIDPLIERTRSRPLADGRLCVGEALAVFFVLSGLAFCLVLFLNALTIYLSIAGLALAAFYPFVKRFSSFPQFVLGVAFGWGAVMAWAAVHETISIGALLIFCANVAWSAAYDTQYALMDAEDDLKAGVKSTAIFFGRRVFAALVGFYSAFAALLVLAGLVAGMGAVFYASVVAVLFVSISNVLTLRAKPSPERAFAGFVANAVGGGVILAAVIIDLNFMR